MAYRERLPGRAAAAESSKQQFATYIVDVLSPLGPVATGKMFGGYNVSLSGVTFALVIANQLYLKVGDENRADFEREGLPPFVYAGKGGKLVTVNYYQAPDCIDDWDLFEPWVRGAYAVALRARTPKKSAGRATRSKPVGPPAPRGRGRAREI